MIAYLPCAEGVLKPSEKAVFAFRSIHLCSKYYKLWSYCPLYKLLSILYPNLV